jgi:hypothetical protein
MLQISESSSYDVPASLTCAVLYSASWSHCPGTANTHRNSGLHHACQLSDFSFRRLTPLLTLCAMLRDHSLLALHIIRPISVSARLKFERRFENARQPRREKPLEPGLHDLRVDMSHTHGQESFECAFHVTLRENSSAAFGFDLESHHESSRKVVEHCKKRLCLAAANFSPEKLEQTRDVSRCPSTSTVIMTHIEPPQIQSAVHTLLLVFDQISVHH